MSTPVRSAAGRSAAGRPAAGRAFPDHAFPGRRHRRPGSGHGRRGARPRRGGRAVSTPSRIGGGTLVPVAVRPSAGNPGAERWGVAPSRATAGAAIGY